MVPTGRNRFRQSVHHLKKNLIPGLGLIALFACSNAPEKKFVPAPSLQTVQTSSGLRLTSIGQNQGGRFSPDGRKVLFISSQREQHSNHQLYELSLDTFRERRVTYHDGDCLEGEYSPDGKKILYASTTDELKEHPILLNPKKNTRPPTELYLSDPRGMQIERLTHEEGYQGQATWVSAKRILFVSSEKDRLQIQSMILGSRHDQTWQADKTANLSNPVADGGGTRVAWLIERPEPAPLQLGLKSKGKVQSVDLPFEQVQSLQWTRGPNDKTPRLLISAKKKTDKFLSGWILDTEQKCAIALLQESGNLKDLQASPNQEKVVFTFEAGENSQQLYLREFPPIPTNCEPLTAPPAPQTSVSTTPAADPQEHPKTP